MVALKTSCNDQMVYNNVWKKSDANSKLAGGIRKKNSLQFENNIGKNSVKISV